MSRSLASRCRSTSSPKIITFSTEGHRLPLSTWTSLSTSRLLDFQLFFLFIGWTLETCPHCWKNISASCVQDGLSWSQAPVGGYRIAQKNFFSLNGFSEAGTGVNKGSSLAWASQYAIKSAAALDTCGRKRYHMFSDERGPGSRLGKALMHLPENYNFLYRI